MIEEVLQYWFGDWDDSQPLAEDDRQTHLWWGKSEETDRYITDHFGTLLEQDLSHWETSLRGALARVLVLDQFSRVVFRGTARSFSQDAEARAITRRWLHRSGELRPIERQFLGLPLTHSEDPADHVDAVAHFEAIVQATEGTARAEYHRNALRFQHMHKDIVDRFGRYPHRNAWLGRESTEEELEFLKGPNSSF